LLEAVLVIKRKIPVHILLVFEAQSFLLGYTAESLHVDGIVIGENAVEIKDDGANHEET
jgi:hypothetical protein